MSFNAPIVPESDAFIGVAITDVVWEIGVQ